MAYDMEIETLREILKTMEKNVIFLDEDGHIDLAEDIDNLRPRLETLLDNIEKDELDNNYIQQADRVLKMFKKFHEKVKEVYAV